MASTPPSSSSSPPSHTLYQVRCKLPIHLHPSRLNAIEQGIHEHLHTLLMHYSSDVSGVILSYSDIVLCDSSGLIFFDRPYINFHILVTFVVFKVVPKQYVVGVVNKLGPDHVGLLIHGAFNAVIPQDQLPEHYYYQQQHHPVRIEMMVDERYTPKKNGTINHSHPSHASAATTPAHQLSKKQLVKQQKLQEKEERRLAYHLAHGEHTAEANNSNGLSDAERMQYNIRLGSRLRFQIVSVHPGQSFLSILGSLTSDPALADTALINDDIGKQLLLALGTDIEWEQKEQERLTQEEENDVARLFGVTPKRQQTHTTAQSTSTISHASPPEKSASVTATTTHTPPAPIDPSHISKKEQKAMKKQQKAERKAAKAARKREKEAINSLVQTHSHDNHQPHTSNLVTSNGIAPMSAVVALEEKERKKHKEKRKREEAQPLRYANHLAADDDDESNVVLNTPTSAIHPPAPSSLKMKKRKHSTEADSQLGAVKRKKSHSSAA